MNILEKIRINFILWNASRKNRILNKKLDKLDKTIESLNKVNKEILEKFQ